jgi:hypothetical protein
MSLPEEIEWIIYTRADTITKLKMHKAFPTKFPEPFYFPKSVQLCKYASIRNKTILSIHITPIKYYEINMYGVGHAFGTKTHIFLIETDDLLGEWIGDYEDVIENGTVFHDCM